MNYQSDIALRNTKPTFK